MSLAGFDVTRARETHVAALLLRNWSDVRSADPGRRLWYTTGALVCDAEGRVSPRRLAAALADITVTTRALSLLAVVRYTKGDGGEWTR